MSLLSITLNIGFRLVAPGHNQPTPGLDHTCHHGWMFGTAFSSGDDEIIADVMCAWIASGYGPLPDSCMRDFTKRMDTPFPPRLRRMSILAIECIRRGELDASGLDVVRLLDKLASGETFGVGFWEKLEGWMACEWRPELRPEPTEVVRRVTLKMLSQRPSAIQRFEGISDTLRVGRKAELRRLCDQARTEQLPPELSPP